MVWRTARSRATTRNARPRRWCRLALRSALSDRAADDKVLVIDDWGIDERRRRRTGVKLLEALGLARRRASARRASSSCCSAPKRTSWKSLRNLGERVQIVLPEELNTYDVLMNDWFVFSQASLDGVVARLGDGEGGSDE